MTSKARLTSQRRSECAGMPLIVCVHPCMEAVSVAVYGQRSTSYIVTGHTSDSHKLPTQRMMGSSRYNVLPQPERCQQLYCGARSLTILSVILSGWPDGPAPASICAHGFKLTLNYSQDGHWRCTKQRDKALEEQRSRCSPPAGYGLALIFACHSTTSPAPSLTSPLVTFGRQHLTTTPTKTRE